MTRIRPTMSAWTLAAALLLAMCAGTHATAAVVVGKTEFARGAAAARLAEQAARILGKDADVFLRDVVQTGPSSFAIIGFIDAARVTVRPNTELTVKQYLDDHAELGLHRGGIRGSSGAIAKLLPGQFKIETPVATVEVHNARFDVRYCEDDCADEESRLDAVENPELAPVVGRIATLRGKATATDPDGETRSLGLGAPLHELDVIKTESDSYALIVFRDSSKVTLEANSEFHIEAQKYFEGSPEKNEVIYRFMRGGMRALTGSISKESPEKYQVRTPVATTGIRGTGFDLACRGECISRRIEGSPQFITAAIPDGLYSLVWQGAIHQDNEAGSFDLTLGRSGYIANRQSPLIQLPSIPAFMEKNPAPRPDRDNSSLAALFGTTAMQGSPRGLYVHVRSGHVRIVTADGRKLDLGTGETGYAGLGADSTEDRASDTGASGLQTDRATASTDSAGVATRGADSADGQVNVTGIPGSDGDQPPPGTTAPGARGSDIVTAVAQPRKTPDASDIQIFRLQSPRAFLVNDPYPKPEATDLNQDRFTLLDDEDLNRWGYFECICPL